uniref:Uncharacterized protein n=1 Tax=Oryza punctata TaxID=4537 RepID=A0A0E0KPI8_ORYPU
MDPAMATSFVRFLQDPTLAVYPKLVASHLPSPHIRCSPSRLQRFPPSARSPWHLQLHIRRQQAPHL